MGASAKPQDNSSETSGLDIDLDPSYVPSDDEPFMNEKQLKFFERQLMDWKNSILAEGVKQEWILKGHHVRTTALAAFIKCQARRR